VLLGALGIAVAGTLALGGYFGASPATYLPARPAARPPALAAVFWSGDMGMRIGFGSDIPDRLAQLGVPALAVSSPALFGSGRDAAFAHAAVAHSLADVLRRSGAQRVVLIGFSFGADVVGASLGRLPPALRARIAQVVLVGPGPDIGYHANPFGIFYLGLPRADPARLAASLRGLPLTCVFAAAEADSLCREPSLGGARMIAVPGGHMMLAHRAEVTDAVIRAVLHPPEPLS
jgi:type IV secretory pathway VirJ component